MVLLNGQREWKATNVASVLPTQCTLDLVSVPWDHVGGLFKGELKQCALRAASSSTLAVVFLNGLQANYRRISSDRRYLSIDPLLRHVFRRANVRFLRPFHVQVTFDLCRQVISLSRGECHRT